jgi:hypothetical protein
MPITITEHTSWWSRLKSSFFGFLISFVLVIAGLMLLAWNEHRTLKTFKGLKAAGDTVVTTPADRVDPAIDGKLVYLSAEVTSDESVSDPEFGIEAPALVLRRSVEMYQWKENKRTEEREKLGGGKETTTTFTYEKVWNDDLIDSGNFQESGHANPSSMPYRDENFSVSDARLGAWRADDSILSALDGQPLSLSEDGEFPDGFWLADGQTLYSGENPKSPQIGDLRVKYSAVPPQPASVIAQADGDGLTAWTSPAQTLVFLVEAGIHDAATLIASAQSSNSTIGWVLRAVGFVLLWIAFSMMLGPLSTLAAVLPPLGRAVGTFTGMIAFALAAVLASVTIVLSWILVRPLWAVGIVLAIVAAIAMWSRKSARNASPPAPAPFMSPPPMGPPPMPPPPPR